MHDLAQHVRDRKGQMQTHHAMVRWSSDGDFAKGRYTRAHDWHFDGGAVVRASASPSNVPLPFADASAVDPEEAFVAAVSSCHMLWFLDFARRAGFKVASYEDSAEGHMTEGPRPWIERVDLRPNVTWTGTVPTAAECSALHEKAHDACFIANSIKSEVIVHA